MKQPVFDNIRWGEFMGWATAVGSIMTAIETSPAPPSVKAAAHIGGVIITFILSYLRNPKTLTWDNNPNAPKGDYP